MRLELIRSSNFTAADRLTVLKKRAEEEFEKRSLDPEPYRKVEAAELTGSYPRDGPTIGDGHLLYRMK
jgi:hypothetical protein